MPNIFLFLKTGDLSSDAKVSSSVGFSEEVKNGTKKVKKPKKQKNDDKICGKLLFLPSCNEI